MENKLSICAVSWNLHGESPSEESIDIVFNLYKKQEHDMYVIGTQECLRSILISLVYWDKTYWEELFINYINKNNKNKYYIAACGTLSAMHIMVVVKKMYENLITNVGYSWIKTGAYYYLANKGAIYVWFNYNNIPLTFINCHLAAYRECQVKRNENFEYIINTFEVTNANEVFKVNNVSEDLTYVKGKEILNKFEFILFMGDLNSRNDHNLVYMLQLIKNNQLKEMLEYDQLNQAIKKGEVDMNGLVEPQIKFFPTFKYEPGSIYNYISDSEENIPSFTDRIFYKVKDKKNVNIKIKNYTSVTQVTLSDHKPVILDFELIF